MRAKTAYEIAQKLKEQIGLQMNITPMIVKYVVKKKRLETHG